MEKTVTLETIQNYINDLAEQKFYEDLKAAVDFIENNPILRDLKITPGSNEMFLTNRNGTWQEPVLTIAGHTPKRVYEHMETVSNIAKIRENLLKQYVDQETTAFLNKVAGSQEDYPF